MKIQTILDQIDLGSMALPEFQRGYVWNREQVKSLMQSLYKQHPVGSLLVWVTKTETANTRGDAKLTPGSVKLLLDGQQRITSLYGIIRGAPPRFFDGDTRSFTDLYFNLDDETFEFHAPLKMRGNPVWIDVTQLMRIGSGKKITELVTDEKLSANITIYINRLTAIENIKQIDLHTEEVAGEDKTVDVVVDIFNRVNSGGTKLSKGDLALAEICAKSSDARAAMKARLDKWKRAGFNFKLEWLLRCVNAIVTGEALFLHLENVKPEAFHNGLQQAEESVDKILNMISSRLGLDHDRVLGSRYSFPVLARYLVQRGGRIVNQKERGKLLYWYVNTFLWGRYSGSTESVMDKDLDAIEKTEGALDRLILQLRQNRGDLKIKSDDFLGWSTGTRFYPLLYMLTRSARAKDWASGDELSSHLLGRMSSLEIHHIFPKALLKRHGIGKRDTNALANFTFLTKDTNLLVKDRNPAEYLEEYSRKNPGVIESHWIPLDRNLWKPENYLEFLAARRELLADAANEFLDSLLAGSLAEEAVITPVLERPEAPAEVTSIDVSDDEEYLVQQCNRWVVKQGLPAGEVMYELVDSETGEAVAILDLAWPNGLQEGFSQPVALLIDEPIEVEEEVNRAGYRFFTNLKEFRGYVKQEILPDMAD
jgi:hypothetical protein